MQEPELHAGDLLYFPRGIIHHAPNQDASTSSVHLTISTFQRQTRYDLAQKAFEEAMSELWEDDEALRRSLPWRALAPGASCHAALCKDVSAIFRRLADAFDAEASSAQAAGEADAEGGPVAVALAELGAEFVRHRMPPAGGLQHSSEESMCLVSPATRLCVP